MAMTRRTQDMRAEAELALFLDAKFWVPYVAMTKGSSFTRVVDRDLQLKGVDVKWCHDNLISYVDEKAQLYYVNRTLPTFAFEINSFQRYGLVVGWLLADNLLTTDYHLIYPEARHSDLLTLSHDDFTRVEIICVNKSRLWDWLNAQGLTKQELFTRGQFIQRAYGPGRIRIETNCRDAYFIRSAVSAYAEAPLNLVIRKNVLESIATFKAVVTQEGFCINQLSTVTNP